MCYTGVKKSAKKGDRMKNYFPVNDLAPQGEALTVYVKKVPEKKSDGFAVVENGKVFVIDIGKRDDDQLIRFLADLREKWLGETRPADGMAAKLELTLIISHAHTDHMAALPLLLGDERFCVTEIYAPERAIASIDRPEELTPLVTHEERLDRLCAQLAEQGHTAAGVTRIPFGSTHILQSGNTTLKIYAAPFDWSEDRPSDKEGIRFIRNNNPSFYSDRPAIGYTNGILNGNSLWVKITKGKHSVLITGDQRDSDEMLGAMIRYHGEGEFACDVLKLPHHGVGNYPPYLLQVAKPKYVVFTASRKGATPETVQLCEEMGCINYYTRRGDLFFSIGENGIIPCGIEPQ